MKIIKSASGKKQVKISKKEWESIGRKAGWMGKEIIYVDKIGDVWKVWSISCGQHVDLGEYPTDEDVSPVIKRYRGQGYEVKINVNTESKIVPA